MPTKKFILNEIDIVYKPALELIKRPVINCAEEAHSLFRENWDSTKIAIVEQFKVMLLNRSNRVLGISTVSLGGISGTVTDQKIIFAIALKAGASSIILAHNHPSGNMKPSDADIAITKKIRECGGFLDIQVLDHIILNGLENRFNSLNDHLNLF